jgi:hypothetical protein
MNPYAELEPRAPDAFDPREAVTVCIESGAHALLADDGSLPAAFFDLSTGVAGEMVHRLTLYGVRMAAVVPDPALHSVRFQEFAREANRGHQFRFFPTREAAIGWLESE